MTADDAPGGPLAVQTLRVMGRRATTHPLVRGWSFQPDGISPRHLEMELDAEQYPRPVGAARLDVCWFEGGDYTVHYVASRRRKRWQRRWDRHPKPDAPMAHFHPPPDAAADAEASELDDSHHLGALFAVLDGVEERVSELHGERSD